MKTGDLIKKYGKIRGMPQKQLAAECEHTDSAIRNYELGNTCTMFQKVDAALKRYWARYNRRVGVIYFSLDEVKADVNAVRTKHAGC